MQLRFLGGASSLTGARLLVEYRRHRVLLDCGLFQGLKRLRLLNRSALSVASGSLEAVVLTQAHSVHSGFLPMLVQLGFRGPVYATPAAIELCRLLLPDAARLQEAEAREANRMGYGAHSPALPLYTEEMACRALEQLQPGELDTWMEAAPGIQLQLRAAGQALGAASVHLRCGGHSLMYSGALGRNGDALVRPPAAPPGVDLLLLDAAYGNRILRRADALTRLARLLHRMQARGGKLLLPVDAAGPLQHLLFALLNLRAAGRLPELPVWLDSGIAADAVAVYQRHALALVPDAQVAPRLLDGVHVASSSDEVQDFMRRPSPGILIATEGVSHGHAVTRLLCELLPDARHAVAYTCHPPVGTPGAALLAGEPSIRFRGACFPARAEVVALDGLCGRADRRTLLDWVGALPSAPQHLYLVLGEPDAAESLRQAIAERWHWPCSVSQQLELANIQEAEPLDAPGLAG